MLWALAFVSLVYAMRLARHQTVVMVGDTVFVHGGLLPSHLELGLGRINQDISDWMRGASPRPPPIVLDENSPIWTRVYSDGDPGAGACGMLAKTLTTIQAARMVIGHTVQKDGITSGCNGQVWRIDVGMSGTYGGRVQVLELRGARARTPSTEPTAGYPVGVLSLRNSSTRSMS